MTLSAKMILDEKCFAECEFLTRDISADGAFFMTPTPFSLGIMGKIFIYLPLKLLKNGNFFFAQIAVLGRVIRRDLNGMAVQFNEKSEIMKCEFGNQFLFNNYLYLRN